MMPTYKKKPQHRTGVISCGGRIWFWHFQPSGGHASDKSHCKGSNSPRNAATINVKNKPVTALQAQKVRNINKISMTNKQYREKCVKLQADFNANLLKLAEQYVNEHALAKVGDKIKDNRGGEYQVVKIVPFRFNTLTCTDVPCVLYVCGIEEKDGRVRGRYQIFEENVVEINGEKVTSLSK